MNFARRLAFSTARQGRPTVTQTPVRRGFGSGFSRRTIEFGVQPSADRPSSLVRSLGGLTLPLASRLASDLTWLLEPGETVDRQRPAVFVDLETDGLMGGGAVCPFMVGMAGYLDAATVRVDQWVLLEPRAERDMLDEVVGGLVKLCGTDTRLVTYNGASFDRPVLRNRLARLGVDASAVLTQQHLDLLHPVRRVYSGALPDCRLPTLERHILGVDRHQDISGAEVAELFGRLIRCPEDPAVLSDLERARLHNQIDLLTLPALLSVTAKRIHSPTTPQEVVRAGRHLARVGQVSRALSVLDPWVESWRRVDSASGSMVEGMMLAATLLRRSDRLDDAVQLWQSVCRSHPGHAAAHEALAKHLEHVKRTPMAALEVALGSSEPCPHRVARLRRKAAALDA